MPNARPVLFEQSLSVIVEMKCLSYRPALFPFAPE